MDLDVNVTISPSVIAQQVGGETVLLHLDSEEYFGLDQVGTRFWQLLEEHGELRRVHNALLEEFDVDAARLGEDLSALLAEITGLGLVSVTAQH